MNYVLGLDIGTSGIKALLVSEEGGIVDISSVPYTPDVIAPGFVEQDPEIWWTSTKAAIKKLTDKNKALAGNIVALACSGQMHSSVFLDAGNNVIRPAILWNDTRTSAQVSHVYETMGGLENLLKNTCNRVFEGFTLPKILWLSDNEPDNYKKLCKVLMPKDYINFKLTGNIYTDCSDAAGTSAFDVKNKKWSSEIITIFGLNAHSDGLNTQNTEAENIFPEAVESASIIGTVLKNISEELGLPDSVKVAAGGADNSCAAIGNGIISEGDMVISIGTSGTVVTFLKEIKGKVTGDIHLFNYSYPDSYYAMGCMLSAGESLNWLKKNILSDISYDEIDILASNAPSGSGGLIFLPYLYGERSPYPNPNAKGVFFGLNAATDKACMIRSVMEGVAFNIKAMSDVIEDFTEIKNVYITGGGAKSTIWGQIIADILNRKLLVTNSKEGPAFGAALISGVAAGLFADFKDAKDRTLSVVRSIEPNITNHKLYSEKFILFKDIYRQNEALF